MKYKIFVDTNQLYNDYPLNEVFNTRVKEIRDFLDSNNVKDVTICIPEIVIRERIQHKLEKIDETLDVTNKNIKSLKSFNHSTKEVVPRKDYKKQLEKNADDFLKKYKVEKISIPKIKKSVLIDRALSKIKPFNDNTSGFKDTLIFLSIVEDALKKSGADKYIFCTKDSNGFDDEVIKEFKSITKKDLIILVSITKVQEKLDELLPLNLHLKTRNDKIKNLILSNLGDVMTKINQAKDCNPIYRGSSITTTSRHSFFTAIDPAFAGMPLEDDSESIAGYNFSNADFVSFTEIEADTFRVRVSVSTEIKYKDGHSEVDSLSDPYWITRSAVQSVLAIKNNKFRTYRRNFYVDILCNLKDNTTSVSSVDPSLFY